MTTTSKRSRDLSVAVPLLDCSVWVICVTLAFSLVAGGDGGGLGSLLSGRPLGGQGRQPFEPARQVPVPLAEQLHRCRQQHAPDQRRVEKHSDGKTDTELF